MEEKRKKKIYFWLFIIATLSSIFFLFLSVSFSDDVDLLNKKIDDMNNIYCADFSNTTDIKEVRSLAESFIISEVKNAYNIQFKEIYLVGNKCNSKWWVVAEYDKKVDEDDYIIGVSFLEINPINKELVDFITFTCSSLRKYGEDDYGVLENSCLYSWSVSEILGENKQEASNYIDLLE